MPDSYSLLELHQYIRRVVALNFDQPVWIEAEISQASSARGHWYLDLLEKEGEQIVAQGQAALWANVYHFLKRKLPVPPEDLLQPGLAVKLKVNVDFHERYGLKLIIEDIDSTFTLGKLALQREDILRQLAQAHLLDKNRQRTLPAVLQRLAIISSSRAAGWIDFQQHLKENSFGYAIGYELFEAAMQGQVVERDILAAFSAIEKRKTDFDAVCLLRGGGGRTELAVFDNLALARRLAGFPLPVLVGIGHETDQSILDVVAHTSLKTPTAVADFIVAHNAGFERTLDQLSRALRNYAAQLLEAEKRRLRTQALDLRQAVQQYVWKQDMRLERLTSAIRFSLPQALQKEDARISRLTEVLQALDPDLVLARGYTITSCNGLTLTQAAGVLSGQRIQTSFHDGTITSIVE